MAEKRITVLILGIAGALLLVAGALARLQLLDGEQYRVKAEQRRNRTVLVPPERGRIFDRRGVLLADNAVRFDLHIIPAAAREIAGGLPALFSYITTKTGADRVELESRYQKIEERVESNVQREIRWLERRGRLASAGSTARNRQEADARRAVESRSYWLVRALEPAAREPLHRAERTGLVIVPRSERIYPQGNLAVHLLGHLRELNSDEYAARQIGGDYRTAWARRIDPDRIDRLARHAAIRTTRYGAAGIEKQYDFLLRGRFGLTIRQATPTGRALADRIDPEAGLDLTLTLDVALQQAAEEALAGKVGALVAIDPRTGELLAMATAPTYDPTDPATREQPNAPLMNRCIAGLYSSGSTMKPFDAVAGLEELPGFAHQSYHCNGQIRLGNTTMRCLGSHGSITLGDALKRSCNVFFYRTGIALGVRPSRLTQWFRRFGVGSLTGVDLPGEKRGALPEPTGQGAAANLAIGQTLTVTPLRMATAFSAFANGGQLVTPHLLKGEAIPGRPIGIAPEHLKLVRAGLRRVVNESGGTAYRAFQRTPLPRGIKAAGKTGSAQHSGPGKTHAWFIGFAPFDRPTICVAVIVEQGGGGGSVAAPIAAAIMARYFEDR